MKTNKLILPILTGVLFAAVAHAQLDVTITGSTAGRKIMYDRAATLFDTTPVTAGGALSFANSANVLTAQGTMSNAIPSLGSTVVTLRFSMSGSAQGLVDLNNSASLVTTNIGGGTTSFVPDIAFADNWPAAVAVNVPTANLTANSNLCVLPFVFFKNVPSLSLANVTNITREQTLMLMTSSGFTPGGLPGMFSSFLGGSDTNVVYLFGRDIGSGTRIGTFKCTGFAGSPRQWITNNAGGIVLAASVAGNGKVPLLDITGNAGDGFSSGGDLTKAVTAAAYSGFNIIGYAGESDASGNGSTTNNWLRYEGVFPSHDSVANGAYPIWCYYHANMRAGQNTGSKGAVFNALLGKITDSTYQATDTTFRANAVAIGEMKVKRGVDGGSFTTTPVAGW